MDPSADRRASSTLTDAVTHRDSSTEHCRPTSISPARAMEWVGSLLAPAGNPRRRAAGVLVSSGPAHARIGRAPCTTGSCEPKSTKTPPSSIPLRSSLRSRMGISALAAEVARPAAINAVKRPMACDGWPSPAEHWIFPPEIRPASLRYSERKTCSRRWSSSSAEQAVYAECFT